MWRRGDTVPRYVYLDESSVCGKRQQLQTASRKRARNVRRNEKGRRIGSAREGPIQVTPSQALLRRSSAEMSGYAANRVRPDSVRNDGRAVAGAEAGRSVQVLNSILFCRRVEQTAGWRWMFT